MAFQTKGICELKGYAKRATTSRHFGDGAWKKHIIELKWLSQLGSKSRATVFRHQASAAAFISRGFNASVQNTSDVACRTHINCLSGYSFSCGVLVDSVLGNNFSLARRQFASHSNDGDGLEARLMREEDDNFGTEHDYSLAQESYVEKYGEQEFEELEGEAPGWRDENLEDGENAEGGMESSYASSDSDSDMNVASDEEFEAEQTDEELEELLANTPLFEPPELEDEGTFQLRNSFRPEGHFYFPGMEYDPEELDISKPLPPPRRQPREKLEFSVQEIIDKADFRNVRFLTQFIGETGNILARKQFKMRAKSHRRITKAIKTARFFGLMPYTNMGRPKYVFNEPYDSDDDFYESDDSFNQEVNTTQYMAEGSERQRLSGSGAFEDSYHNRTPGGRYDWRRDQSIQRKSG